MNAFRLKNYSFILLILFLIHTQLNAQIVLLGENDPYKNMNDGDFNTVWDYWRNARQSPFWITKAVKGDSPMGLHYGTLFCSNEEGIAESKILDTNPNYQVPKVGDVLKWSFGADLEYICDASISVSLVFGNRESVLAKKVKLIGSDKIVEHFEGTYTISEEDALSGLPFVRVRYYSEKDVKIYLNYVNISVINTQKKQIKLLAELQTNGFLLSWDDPEWNDKQTYSLYRKPKDDKHFIKIQDITGKSFLDATTVNGIDYTYILARIKDGEVSNKTSIQKKDTMSPGAPINLKTEIFDTEIKINWTKSNEKDVSYYSVFRGDTNGTNYKKVGDHIKKSWFEDILAPKGIEISYVVYAHDYSGNRSAASKPIKAKTKTVFGASFSDLIRPIPIHNELKSDLWGATGVIPRDPENGAEDPNWSYWGGHPVKDKDNDYHMLVARWPENGLKGHWEWPSSTVAHVVSKTPTGPYIVKEDIAYSYKNGLGHNPDIILLNDGTYALYSLIEWEPTIFTSASMNGPWKRKGVIEVDMETINPNDDRTYQYLRNLSGVQLDDGRVLMVSKFGCMMISENGLLGPYKIVSKIINENQTIPDRYRESRYEDPVMWRDHVQFHLIINAFLDYRAIYLRSKDGIHWKYDPGLAYTPDFTKYQDGTQTHWYKLERPHIIQDAYGRATHLSVAVIDVPKKDDYGNDNHNSKNMIIPLTVPKQIKILNKRPLNASTKTIKILVLAEDNFNPQTDIDIKSLRLGASEEVNLGRGCQVLGFKNKGKDLIIEFDGQGHGINNNNFVCKLLGKTKKGALLIGYSKLPYSK